MNALDWVILIAILASAYVALALLAYLGLGYSWRAIVRLRAFLHQRRLDRQFYRLCDDMPDVFCEVPNAWREQMDRGLPRLPFTDEWNER